MWPLLQVIYTFYSERLPKLRTGDVALPSIHVTYQPLFVLEVPFVDINIDQPI